MRPPRRRSLVAGLGVVVVGARASSASSAAATPTTPIAPPTTPTPTTPTTTTTPARPRPKLLVSTPPDRTIHAPLGEIAAAVDARLAAAGATASSRALFARAARLVASSVALTHADLRRSLQAKYLPFYAASNRQPLFSSKPPTGEQLDAGEVEFVRALVDALLAARYSPLTRQQQTAALNAAFRLSVPARVDFSRLDASLLSRFWRSTPALQALRGRLPRTADRVAIFHRGVGVARARGLFLAEKLDLLVRYCVVAPLAALGQFARLAVLGRLVFFARVLLRSVLRVARRVSPLSSAFVAESAAELALEARAGAAPADAVWGGGTASVTSSSGSCTSDDDDEDDDDGEDNDDDDAAGWLGYFDESSSSSSSSGEEEEEEEEAGQPQQQRQQQQEPPPPPFSAPSSGLDSTLSSLDEERELYARWRRRQRRRRQRALDQWANTSVGAEAVAPAALHDGRHLVARRTLAHVLPTAGAVLASFFRPVELQEPAFGEVIILYREREEGPEERPEEEGAKAEAGAGAATAAAAASAAAPAAAPPAMLLLRKRLRQQTRSGEDDVAVSAAGWQWQQRLAMQAQKTQQDVAGAVASAATAAAEAAQAAASAATAAAEAAITTAEAKPGALATSALVGLAQGVLSGDDAGGVRETVESAGQRQRMSPAERRRRGARGEEEQRHPKHDDQVTPGPSAAVAAAAAATTAATTATTAAAQAAAMAAAEKAAADDGGLPGSAPMPFARNIQLRRYRDVPLADLECCVPFLELGVRAAQALRLGLATVGAIAAALAAGLEGHREAALAAAAAAAGAAVSPGYAPVRLPLLPVLWAALAGMVGAALQARDEIAAQRAQALTTLLELQQGKLQECQGAVIGVVAEALADATLKEALLAYGVLLVAREEEENEEGGDGAAAGAGSFVGLLTANEVSQRAQRLLAEDLGVHGAVFSARAVLPALERAGLVLRRPGSGRRQQHQHPHGGGSRPPSSSAAATAADTYEAVPLEAAVRVLEQDWASAHERVDLTLSASASEGEGQEGEEGGGIAGGGGGDGRRARAGPGMLLGGNSPWLRHAPATTPSPSPQLPPLVAAATAGGGVHRRWRRAFAVVGTPPLLPRPRPFRPLLRPRPPRALLASASRGASHVPLIRAF